MKKTFLSALFVSVLALSGCATAPEAVNPDVDPVPVEVTTGDEARVMPRDIQLPEGFAAYNYSERPFAFAFPQYYDMSGESNSSTEFLERVNLTHEKYDDGVARMEGPPGISVLVFEKPENVALKDFLTQKTNSTNYANEDQKSNEKTVKLENGLEFLTYQGDGLYTYQYYVIEKGPYVYAFSAFYLNETEPEKADLARILNTLKFYE